MTGPGERTQDQDAEPEPRVRAASALEKLYESYADRLFRYATALLSRPEDAGDVIQSVFLKLIPLLQAGKELAAPAAYLFRAVRNEALRVLGRPADRPRPPLRPIEPGVTQQEAASVATALAQIPAEQREVVVLKIYDRLTFREIAGILDESPNTVAHRYQYALEKLKTILGAKEDGEVPGEV